MDPAIDPSLSPAEMARAIREQKARAAKAKEEAAREAELAEKMAMKKKMLDLQRKYGAANSHLMSDQYMEEFEKGWQMLMDQADPGANGAGSKAPQLTAGKKGTAFFIEGSDKGKELASRPGTAATTSTSTTADAKSAMSAARTRNLINYGKTAAAAAFVRWPAQVVDTWRQGPADPAGVLCDISDRPSLCSAANWGKNEVVVGSSDHALYVLDGEKGTKKRQLYNKSSGHQEWVTAVTCTPDGKVVSGGMDSKLWLWPAGTTRGIQMEGHFGPIAKLEYDGASGLVVSASYDKTVRMWHCGTRGEERVLLAGHDAPVMELNISKDGKIITGDRSGNVILWDTSSSDVSWRLRGVHTGHVTSLAWCDAEDPDLAGFFVSGGQDGHVRVWDPREKKNPKRIMLHVNKEGKGAVSSICGGGAAAANKVVSCGADMTFRVLEPRKGFALMSTVKLNDFPYSMAVAGGLALVGCGDGALYVIDIREGKTLYALGAHKGALRCIEACGDRLFTSGDDGNTMLFTFPGIETTDVPAKPSTAAAAAKPTPAAAARAAK